ncbi:MAG: sugar phosphate isomerase/epimerase [Clostridia bacterium]|nr:sugar phosphate isomerase/epimerase [Clostridia bacterium]
MKLSVQNGNLNAQFGHEQAYRMIREAGFDAIDWNLDHALTKAMLASATELRNLCIFEKELPEIHAYYAEELEIIRKNGLTFAQCHAPFPPYLPGRPDVLEYSIGIYRRLIEFCQEIGCFKVVIHGITKTLDNKVDSQEDIDRMNRHMYESLIDTLKKTDVTVCLENLFCSYNDVRYMGVCSDPHEAAEEIDRLNALAGKTCFGLCLDTGHLQLGHMRFHRFIPILGKRIVALHIHDNDAIHDRHMAPYTGTILWDEFYEELRKIGYDQDLSFETFRQVDRSVIAPELAPVFLKLIADVGAFFRKKIQEDA